MTTQLPFWSVLPFVGLLLSIAIMPLHPWTKHRWHHNSFQLGVALFFGLPVAISMVMIGNSYDVIHALVEYSQFITLLGSLFFISGGIFLGGDIEATPKNNTIFLVIGTILASFIGTTGAAMLLIRPLLNTNKERQHKTHTVLFAIFMVANCGGLLTPLGDPPLFLGMLRGVPFAWTFNLLPEWLFVNGFLALMYYILDKKMYSLESKNAIKEDKTHIEPLYLNGKNGFVFLLGVVLSVAFLPSVDLHAIHEGHASIIHYVPVREIAMISMILCSFFFGSNEARNKNEFDLGPIKEVAALFIGIFTAMIPALIVLRQVAPTLPLNEVTFFIFTGGLSSVLDNAPTYVTFFEMARELGGIPSVAGVFEPYLVSISIGAVFMGAMTYIGNGPNFMVKAIAENMKVEMPSFGGYIIKSSLYLLPVITLMVMIFIVNIGWINISGIVLAIVYAFYISLKR